MPTYITPDGQLYAAPEPRRTKPEDAGDDWQPDVEMEGPRPSRYHVADLDTGQWIVDEARRQQVLGRAYGSALGRIKQAYAAALADARARYSDTEREGWHELIADAKDSGGDCIENYAENLGVSVSEAVDRVLTARDKYRAAYGKATGKLTKLRDEADVLYEAGDIDGLEAMEW